MGRLALLLATVAALALAAVALAANSATYADPSGDAGGGPDVGAVTVSSDDAGLVTIKVTTDAPQIVLRQGVWLLVDTDQNPDSGAVVDGAEWAFDLSWTQGLAAYHVNGDLFDQAATPPSVTATFASPVTTFTFNVADLGITSGFNFAVVSADLVGDFADPAPDYRTFNYQLTAGTQPPALGADTRAPIVRTVKTKAKRGKQVTLDYFVQDGRNESQDVIKIYRNNKVIKTISYTLSDASPFFSYYVKWPVPKTEKGKLKYCVQASDRAGNQSAVSCSAITVS
jgi:hypothetical protein